MERDLTEQANQLGTREEYVAWEQRCDEFIESSEEQSRIKRPRLSIGSRQSVIACIARLESLKDSVRGRFVYVGAGYGLRWREIETAFESRILTGAVINSNHIEPSRFFEDASEIVLERVQCVLQRYDACFAWSVVAALHPAQENGHRKSSYPHYSLILSLQDIQFPMTLSQIKKFENLDDVSVNVYAIEDEIVPIRLADQKRSKHVNLLYVEDNIEGHFALIKDLSRLVSSQISKKEHKKYFCDRSSAKLELHSVDCGKLNDCAIRLPSEDNKWLEFKNHCRKERVPFVVYADLECALEKTDKDTASSTYTYQHHNVFSIGYYVYCSYDDSLSGYRFHRDNNCISWFADELKNLTHSVQSVISTNVPMDFTQDDWRKFNSATHCHVCEKPFMKDDTRARDYCHLTGRYRGPAHSNCNLNYKDSRCIPVVFHNSVTTKNCIQLRFIDSYRFLASSLDKLSSFLSVTKDKLRVLRLEFSHLSDENFNLLTRKGVFPYEYIDCSEKLNESCLPPRESFYSSLTDDTVSESDYAHAVNVWQRFSIQTLGEYSDLYLKTDVLLLADVFENFRDSCVASYGLDPAYYYTLPGFTWDAMLKHTSVKFELLTDIDMVMFVERSIRGGLSQCSNRYARANNKYMPSYDSSKQSSYLMYYDVNNLSGWAMCQPLLYADFRWVDDVQNFDFTTIALDSPTGYILEVDLEYPQQLHDAHTDLPFCPMREKPPGKRDDKLLATLCDKQRYVIHYRNLQQCTRHGLRIAKVHHATESVFSENLVAIELRKFEVKFDKPIYVGMCILDISKTCLYEFHHEYIAPLFREKCKIMYTDTDLIYHVECDDVYEIIKRDIDRFDTSDYSIDNPYNIPLANKKVLGLVKDENNGAIMTEFVGLRAKMYALRVQGKKDRKKAKSVKSNVVARSITFDDYTRCLNDAIETTRRQSCIRSKLYEVYMISETKIALSLHDDKRYIVSGSTDTLPWGHYRVNKTYLVRIIIIFNMYNVYKMYNICNISYVIYNM
ncbi:hypothetical protein ALC62_00752 [Cyphomyrmex costatus]|uniref:DNA-directed DNA polymerase n=1 Tax=Cyphomyrmex costatus TaxID=456900 RepID=A0A151IQ39_9HYME|nr:hypothetical protein ALC62_00752 [Cyphomyrmex costatus]